MTKGHKRGNREVRKPKQEKPPKPDEAAVLPGRSISSLAIAPKKKRK